ncbi:hypothetical protein P171DRAFT_427239 [Karstenula rhodostoma CBS 690.94]|uniref:Mitochondrial outer membrane protein OM14 C-terminal domain-containing protein n=1 Tax=Karstenula rhodostoma CBS 690.94 TaxID=1392251 RepID=A0A9P4PTA7_9PLEO|nr:hypothetical protein P171DRAFT_427239 [Karstenula rhodostoma CBS 690.94]
MSYADVAASGPKQSAEESHYSRAPAQPSVERSDDSVSSLVDVDSPHVSSVPSDFEQQSVKTDTQAERIEFENKAKEASKEAAHQAEVAKDKAKEKAKKDAHIAKKNADNPVVLGNVVTVGILGTVLGVGAYRKYAANELSWKVVGAWAGVVGLFAVGDYYVSNYFFQKYPPKK